MKNLFLSLVVFPILFVIGCQENTITDPLSTESSGMQGVTNGTAVKNITQDVPGIIRFENELGSPYPANTFVECFIVAGTIEVTHKVFSLPLPVDPPQYRATVKLCMDAEMKCATELEKRNRWYIDCDTANKLYFSDDKPITLTKYYKIIGRDDGMMLVVDYEVTLDGVSLKNMELRLPKYHVDKIFNNF